MSQKCDLSIFPASVFELFVALFMPAFDPVRDAVLNSPVESRVTSSHSLAVILNDDVDHSSSRPSTHILAHAEPIRRSSLDLNRISSSTIPYNPKVRITPPGSVLTPLSQAEIDKYKSFRGQGVSRLTKRKRSASEETDERPVKRHAGDVSVVVEHCKWPLMFLVYACSSCPSRQLSARCRNRPTTRITHHWS